MVRYTNNGTSRNPLTEGLLLDRYHSTGQYWDGVADADQKRLLLSCPSDAEYALFVIDPTVRTTGGTLIDKAKNVTIDTEGDAPDSGIVNKSTRNGGSIATAQTGGDGETGAFSGGTPFSTKTTGSGSGGSSARPGSTAENGPTNLIYPGGNMVVGATAKGGTRDISIDMDFVEYPIDRIP